MTDAGRSGQTDRIIVLGRVTGVFGTAGALKVQSYTDPSTNLLQYPVWQLGIRGTWRPVKWTEGRAGGRSLIVRMDGADSREGAQALVGHDIGVWRSELPQTSSGEYYWEDLLGLDVFSPSEAWLGKVDHFRETQVHPLLVIRGEREHVVPLVKERLLKVDLVAGRMVVDWQPDWS